jgi:hypothetical protein
LTSLLATTTFHTHNYLPFLLVLLKGFHCGFEFKEGLGKGFFFDESHLVALGKGFFFKGVGLFGISNPTLSMIY